MRGRILLALCLPWLGSCDRAADDPVVARLDGEPIRQSEVSAPAAFRLYLHEVQSHALLEEETRRLVDERLLAAEARRQGLEPAALLARVEEDGPAVGDADVERYLAEHSAEAAAAGPPEVVRPRIRHYLEERARIERRLAFLGELRERARFEWLLAKPALPRARIDVAGAPARGPADARVTIVHLASFGSSDSARSARALARLAQELPESFRWLHLNLLRDHDEAGLRGAELGFAAQDAGRFWELHDALFAREGRLDPAVLLAATREAGLPDDLLARADRAALRQRALADAERARRAGALREPTLFVNGLYWSGLGPYAELRRLLEQELARAPAGR